MELPDYFRSYTARSLCSPQALYGVTRLLWVLYYQVTVFTTSFIWSYQTILGPILPGHCIHHKFYMELPDYFRSYTARSLCSPQVLYGVTRLLQVLYCPVTVFTTSFIWSYQTTWLMRWPSATPPPSPSPAYRFSRNVV